jgi:Ca2+-binding RTX toxin-like protein
MPTTYEVIYLGQLPLIDTVQGNETAESASALLGSYGSSGDPLYDHVGLLTAERLSEDANDTYDVDNSGGYDSFRINGGAPQNFDAVAIYNATLTYADGSTATVTAVVFQDINGNTYLAPEIINNADQAALEAAPIQSIAFTSVFSNTGDSGGDMAGTRIAGDFKDAVDGTTGNDSMGVGYADADGDRITSGNDVIDAKAGDDTVSAGSGSDTILGGDGNDVIDAGTGAAPITWVNVANGQALTGTTGTDYFRVLAENGANATIVLDNNSGGDRTGDGVADYVQVATTNNTNTLALRGFDYGSDRIILQEPYVSISETTTPRGGDDYSYSATITYSNGHTQKFNIEGEGAVPSGSNIFTTSLPGDAGDYVDGGSGNDLISTFDGNDTLYGGTGDDTLRGGTGADYMDGGDGADTFLIEDNFGTDTIIGGEGGTDSDVIDLSLLSGPVTVSYTGDEAGTITDGTDTLTFFEIERLILTDRADVVDASGSTAAVSIDAGDGADRVDGGSGDDSIAGGDGNDSLVGGAGADSIEGGAGDDSAQGGDGNDTIGGFFANEAGDDSFEGGAGDDLLAGGDGSDTLAGGTGADWMFGNADADTFTIENGFGSDTILGGETTTFGTDYDTVDLSALTGPVTVTYTGDEAGTITDGTDTITFSEIERLILTDYADFVDANASESGTDIQAGDGNDTILGGDVNATSSDTIDAGAGDDFVDAGLGDDSVLGGDGNDSIRAGGGDDWVEGGDGNDSLYGGNENDTLLGGVGNDLLNGDVGNDSLVGGDGSDDLRGFYGNDTLDGGAGDDTLRDWYDDDVVSGGDGNDLIFVQQGNDTYDGGADADVFQVQDGFGTDTISGGESVSTGVDFDTLDLTQLSSGGTVVFGSDEAGTLTHGTDSAGFDGIENVQGSAFADRVDMSGDTTGLSADGAAGDDTLIGGSGNDTLAGGDGNDNLTGGSGDDHLIGGSGANILKGGEGADTLDGTGGYSVARYSSSDEAVNVDLSDAAPESGGTAEGDVLINISQVDGSAFNDTLRASDSGTQLKGLGGDDTLIGGSGNDNLIGGDGDDTFVYTPGDGADTITDFNTGNTGTLDDADSTNNDFIDLSAFYDDIWELHADQADDGVLNQSNDGVDGVDYSDNTSFGTGSLTFAGASADSNSFTVENTGVVCFAGGTRILTPHGEVPIERLRVGDLVVTRDNGAQPIVWTGARQLSAQELALNSKLKPIWLAPDLTGGDAPLIVSPQHGLLLRVDGGDETLVRATHLARMRGGKARVMRGCRKIHYHHVMCEAHQILFANGAPAESFYPGPNAFGALSNASRSEVMSLFPGFNPARVQDRYGLQARPIARFRQLPDHLEAVAQAAR